MGRAGQALGAASCLHALEGDLLVRLQAVQGQGVVLGDGRPRVPTLCEPASERGLCQMILGTSSMQGARKTALRARSADEKGIATCETLRTADARYIVPWADWRTGWLPGEPAT